jgi:hypothetical protein
MLYLVSLVSVLAGAPLRSPGAQFPDFLGVFCAPRGGNMTILRHTQPARTEILRTFMPFARPEQIRGLLVGNDLDSVISACYLKRRFGWEVVATYDYVTLWGSDAPDFGANLAAGAYLALDLDICHPQIYSIGHHILAHRQTDYLPGHARTLNPNFLRGMSVANFRRKYPLATIHFLLWLFDEEPASRDGRVAVWLADSAYINAQAHRFADNAREWVDNYLVCGFLSRTLPLVDTPDFERVLRERVFPALSGNPLCTNSGQVTSRHLGLSGYQCQWSDPNAQRAQVLDLFERIAKITGWCAPQLPARFRAFPGQRRNIALAEILSKYGRLEAFLEVEKVFSYVFPYRDTVNFTTGIMEQVFL